jgi:hypothetical protein
MNNLSQQNQATITGPSYITVKGSLVIIKLHVRNESMGRTGRVILRNLCCRISFSLPNKTNLRLKYLWLQTLKERFVK